MRLIKYFSSSSFLLKRIKKKYFLLFILWRGASFEIHWIFFFFFFSPEEEKENIFFLLFYGGGILILKKYSSSSFYIQIEKNIFLFLFLRVRGVFWDLLNIFLLLLISTGRIKKYFLLIILWRGGGDW